MKATILAAALIATSVLLPGRARVTIPLLQLSERNAAVDNVICCCRIHGGGQCCAEVSFCSGTFVPGCFCSNFDSASDLLDKD
jgi:hypothetical protein